MFITVFKSVKLYTENLESNPTRLPWLTFSCQIRADFQVEVVYTWLSNKQCGGTTPLDIFKMNIKKNFPSFYYITVSRAKDISTYNYEEIEIITMERFYTVF